MVKKITKYFRPKFFAFSVILILLISVIPNIISKYAEPKITEILIDVALVSNGGETRSLQLPTEPGSSDSPTHFLTSDEKALTYIVKQGTKKKSLSIPRCGTTEYVKIAITADPWRAYTISLSNQCAKVERHDYISQKLFTSVYSSDSCVTCDSGQIKVVEEPKGNFYLKIYWTFLLQGLLVLVTSIIVRYCFLARRSRLKSQTTEVVLGCGLVALLLISISFANVDKSVSKIELQSREVIGINQPKTLEMDSPQNAFAYASVESLLVTGNVNVPTQHSRPKYVETQTIAKFGLAKISLDKSHRLVFEVKRGNSGVKQTFKSSRLAPGIHSFELTIDKSRTLTIMIDSVIMSANSSDLPTYWGTTSSDLLMISDGYSSATQNTNIVARLDISNERGASFLYAMNQICLALTFVVTAYLCFGLFARVLAFSKISSQRKTLI